MKVVFLSFAALRRRETSHVLEWAQRLRAAGFEVIDHGRHTSYAQIMTDIARCDAMVALAQWHGSTWAVIEHDSAAAGRNMQDGTGGTWDPKPVLFWREPDDDPRDPMTFMPRNTVRLPDDFEAAVTRAIEIIKATGGDAPTA